METKVTKEMVINYLIKGGANKNEVIEIVEKTFDKVISIWSNDTVKQIACGFRFIPRQNLGNKGEKRVLKQG